jgi:hypothetical protein
MAGALRDFFEGTDEISMGGARWRRSLTTDSNAEYPDVIRVPAGAKYMEVIPAANNLKVVEEGITLGTDRDAALTAQDGNAGVLTADKGGAFEVEGGQYVALYGTTVSTGYELGFYTRVDS